MEAQPSYADVSDRGDNSVKVVTWTDVNEGIACFPARMPDMTRKSLMVHGAFGGASVEIEGSNDGEHWVSLRGPDGLVLSLTEENIVTVTQNTVLIKPRIIGGLETKLTFSLLAQ